MYCTIGAVEAASKQTVEAVLRLMVSEVHLGNVFVHYNGGTLRTVSGKSLSGTGSSVQQHKPSIHSGSFWLLNMKSKKV